MNREVILKSLKMSSRSSNRTDLLHAELENILRTNIEDFDQYDIKHEYKIDCAYGNKFSIDIALFKNNELHTCILFKSLESSIQKNRQNNANTSIGEVVRIKKVEDREMVNILFVTLIPNVSPAYSGGAFKNKEYIETSYVDLSKWDDDFVKFTKITYDFDRDFGKKDEFINALELKDIINVDDSEFIKGAKEIL